MKYFVSGCGMVWAHSGVLDYAYLWSENDPQWTPSCSKYSVEDFEGEYFTSITAEEAKRITGELPW